MVPLGLHRLISNKDNFIKFSIHVQKRIYFLLRIVRKGQIFNAINVKTSMTNRQTKEFWISFQSECAIVTHRMQRKCELFIIAVLMGAMNDAKFSRKGTFFIYDCLRMTDEGWVRIWVIELRCTVCTRALLLCAKFTRTSVKWINIFFEWLNVYRLDGMVPGAKKEGAQSLDNWKRNKSTFAHVRNHFFFTFFAVSSRYRNSISLLRAFPFVHRYLLYPIKVKNCD